MNRAMVVPLIVTVLALSTLGIAATTLETTVTTDPDEEIDPPWEALPISQETAAAIQSEMSGGETSDADAADGTAGGGSADRAASGGGATSTAGGTGGGAATAASRSPFDRLLAILATLLRIVLGVVVVGGVAGVAYRYRGQHRSLFGRTPGGDTPAAHPPAAAPWPPSEPTTTVDRAWVQLIGHLDPDRPETITPTDCRNLARRAGLESTAVEAITTAFERVHYGGQSPEAEKSRAQEGLDRLSGIDKATSGDLTAAEDNRSTVDDPATDERPSDDRSTGGPV